jgi:UDP-N-acetylmuramoyl-L-alanyl-D-glutamate--2,6-diaminopimelate ligase
MIGTGKIEIMGKTLTDKYYSMTTPDPPLLYKSLAEMIREGCNAIIMEVSSHALALDKLDPLSFDYGVFTNLSHEHLDFHTDMEGYFQSKAKLFSSCKCGVFKRRDKEA